VESHASGEARLPGPSATALQQQPDPSLASDAAQGSPYCTMMGDPNDSDLDAWLGSRLHQSSTPAKHDQSLGGCSGRSMGGVGPLQDRQASPSQWQGGPGLTSMACSTLTTAQAWAARLAHSTMVWGKGVVGSWGRELNVRPPTMQAGANPAGSIASSSSSGGGLLPALSAWQGGRTSWSSHASELALAAVVGIVVFAAYREHQVMKDRWQIMPHSSLYVCTSQAPQGRYLTAASLGQACSLRQSHHAHFVHAPCMDSSA